MLNLKKYIQVYDTLFKNKESDRILNDFNTNEKFFFNSVLDGVSENSISHKLYNSTPSHQSFQSLKKGLSEKFISMSLFINSGTSFQMNKVSIMRSVLATKIFDLFGQRNLMISISKKTLAKCLKYQFNYEAIDLARIISTHYALHEQDLAKSAKFKSISDASLKLYQDELIAENEYATLLSSFGTKGFSKLYHELKSSADKIQEMLVPESSRIHLYYYLIRYAQFYARDNVAERERVCKEAIACFDNLNYKHELAKSVFVIYLITEYLEHQQLAKAELLIKHFLEETNSKSYQYYRFKELLFRVYLFQGNTDLAITEYEYLKQNLKKMENVFSKDRLLLYQIYIGILTDSKVNFRMINYNLNRVKQDKKGLHVPFLIGQVCYYYIHDRDKLIDKIESLEQYSHRYLTESRHKRTKEFIHILIGSLRGKEINAGVLQKFKAIVASNSLELIQYEKLLSFTLKQATLKLKKSHKAGSNNTRVGRKIH